MTWFLVALLAVAAFGALAFVLKAPRGGWAAIGAALFVGVAGYALQGSPAQPGAPKAVAEAGKGEDISVADRQKLASAAGQGSSWLVIGDALARRGRYADAAGVLLGAVEENDKDPEAWLALGNALVGHAEGALTPASLYAFNKAGEASPDHPGPPFFLGLAMAQSGRLDEARSLWSDLLTRTPADAPWREDLAWRLKRLDAFIAEQNKASGAR